MCWSNERQDAESDLFAAGLAEEHFEADCLYMSVI